MSVTWQFQMQTNAVKFRPFLLLLGSLLVLGHLVGSDSLLRETFCGILMVRNMEELTESVARVRMLAGSTAEGPRILWKAAVAGTYRDCLERVRGYSQKDLTLKLKEMMAPDSFFEDKIYFRHSKVLQELVRSGPGASQNPQISKQLEAALVFFASRADKERTRRLAQLDLLFEKHRRRPSVSESLQLIMGNKDGARMVFAFFLLGAFFWIFGMFFYSCSVNRRFYALQKKLTESKKALFKVRMSVVDDPTSEPPTPEAAEAT